MKEAEFTTLFSHWLFKNKPKDSENYEFKVTNGGTFNLKHWRDKQPHQPRSLKQASGDVGLYHKISDMSMGQKPFDAFFTKNTKSFLIIWFNKYKEFFIIPIKKVPLDDSISWDYCKKHFVTNTLLAKKELPVYDF